MDKFRSTQPEAWGTCNRSGRAAADADVQASPARPVAGASGGVRPARRRLADRRARSGARPRRSVRAPGAQACSRSGSGSARRLIEMALAQPELDVIGVDVHTPGIAAVLAGDRTSTARQRAAGAGRRTRLHATSGGSFARRHPRVLSRPVAEGAPATSPADHATTWWSVWSIASSPVVGCISPPTSTTTPSRCELCAMPIADFRVVSIDRPDWRPLTRYERKGRDAGRTSTDLWYDGCRIERAQRELKRW